MDIEPETLTVAEVARLLSKSESTIWRLYRKGILSGFKLGGSVFIHRRPVMEMLKLSRVEKSAEADDVERG